jgi:hypothetical protein
MAYGELRAHNQLNLLKLIICRHTSIVVFGKGKETVYMWISQIIRHQKKYSTAKVSILPLQADLMYVNAKFLLV